MRVASAGIGGDPPAGELWGGGFIGAKADELVRDAGDGGWAACCASGMKDELPLALIEEPAEGEVAANQRCDDGQSEGFDEPDRIDDLGWTGLGCGAFVWFGSGAGHRDFCIDFSILDWEWSCESLGSGRASNMEDGRIPRG